MTKGSGARKVLENESIPIDAVTIGIIDGFEEGE
ncbi:MAG: hypothetical protein ACRC8F_11445 [Cetobacterium sp.]